MSSPSTGEEPAVAESGPEPGPEVSMTVAGVARRLGIAPATLRTWDRRYGLGPSRHTAGAHRRYAPADVARLETMRGLVMEGVAPADAARAALQGSGAPSVPADLSTGAGRGPAAARRRRGGGQVIAVPGSPAATRGLARAVMGADVRSVAEIITARLDADGVVPTWDDLVLPVLQGVGNRYEATGRGVDLEHLFSEAVVSTFGAVTRRLRSPRNAQPVLLAGAEDEQHTLALHAVAAALAERGIGARMLGMRVPREALAAAIRRTGPVAVLVWAQTPGDDRAEELDALPNVRPAPRVLVGGLGWAESLPAGVERVHSLSDAVDRLVGAVHA